MSGRSFQPKIKKSIVQFTSKGMTMEKPLLFSPAAEAFSDFTMTSGLPDSVAQYLGRNETVKRYNRILEMLVTHEPLTDILHALVHLIEDAEPTTTASILLLSEDKEHLIAGAAPNLPKFYNEAIHGVAIGLGVGSCGTAAFLGERVIVEDIATHPYWSDFKALALEAGLKACWSEPILNSEGQVLGTFAMYYGEPRTPNDSDLQLILEAARLAGLAIERTNDHKQQKTSNSIFDHLPYAIAIMDQNLQILSTNPAFEQITGYTEDEVVSLEPFMLMDANKTSDIYRYELSQLDEFDTYQEELINQKKGGSSYYLQQTVSILRDEEGDISRFIWLFDDISERKQAEKLIEYQANFDLLTGLPNRNNLQRNISNCIRAYDAKKTPFALMIINLDYFKEVNDSLGHQMGDEILKQVAERLQKLERKGSKAVSLGGDEFAILISEFYDCDELIDLATKVGASLSESYNQEHHNSISYITASIGISQFPKDGETIEDLFSSADQAMYAAKDSGRDCYSFYTQGLKEQAELKARIHRDLIVAIANDELDLFYQPILNFETSEVDKVECLIRWFHPELGFIPPDQFIPIAEKSGLIAELGEWIRDQACKQAKITSDAGFKVRFSVNVSTLEFWTGDLLQSFMNALCKYDLTADVLTLEITESLFMKNQQEIIQILGSLRTLGIRISIDDFGTGYSSLAYLGTFPLDELKIDRSFVDGIEAEERKQALVDTMIVLSQKLGMKVVAEGIETKHQLDMLKSKGCDYMQGYYFAKPMNAQDFMAFLQSHQVQ